MPAACRPRCPLSRCGGVSPVFGGKHIIIIIGGLTPIAEQNLHPIDLTRISAIEGTTARDRIVSIRGEWTRLEFLMEPLFYNPNLNGSWGLGGTAPRHGQARGGVKTHTRITQMRRNARIRHIVFREWEWVKVKVFSNPTGY